MEIVERVRALVPTLRERASRTESERTIADETMAALIDSGLFRMLQPRPWGTESAPADFFTAIRVLASGCGSTGWAASLIGATPWHVALLEPRASHDVWDVDADALVTSSYAPMGRLVPIEGGYRLNGSWRSAPGVAHCQWIVLGSLLIGPAGDPLDYTAVLVPREDLTLTDDWNVVGLRGAGCRDVVVRDAFVPLHRVYGSAGRTRIAGIQRQADSPALYRVPFATIHSTAITMPLLGAAEGAYDYHLARMRDRSRLSHGGRKGTEDDFAHVAVARGTAEIDASVLQVDRDLREQMDHARRNEPIPMELRLRSRRDQVRSTERAVEAVDLLFKAAGGHAVRTSTPIQRAWRDVHTGAAHLVNDVDQGLSLYGRWAYGLGVDDSLILV
ncbi:3-hydroxy-9,10-secoandrosta-1,3,5(10)-triene-9,17-dione monooxygenase oxygenase subunit [Nocardioides sp. JQ2195]|uniref:3-hydroxy-9,10-secoandrosta-1,3,5(10)-triene-9, 17-dione monooxygenase oxygenase subunit n=1 Tax=Nocardioides sp. JQ2195 TaxID=2592334 RepID=UPI001F0FC582|nr:3-hydroxy-9,10-secoandrosta-1,3,5(10)-triene-9,17-dione monooxygenase oxygenase subunit [Nocardioides sp. JQ2195]